MAGTSKNKDLHKAKDAKKDEFYTQLTDIEKELKHYRSHFKDKVVYCNCDDPRISNFFHYFSYSFELLRLKKLIATCYKNQDADLFSQNNSERAIYLEYDGDKKGLNVPDPSEIGIIHLKGDGDYPTYDNYDAINVDKTSEIPCDYKGVMGVPITFLDKYNPEQFEIIGITKSWDASCRIKLYPKQIQIDRGIETEVSKLNDGAVLKLEKPIDKTYYRVGNEYFLQLYARVLIKNKKL
jgi:hypothetical protein